LAGTSAWEDFNLNRMSWILFGTATNFFFGSALAYSEGDVSPSEAKALALWGGGELGVLREQNLQARSALSQRSIHQAHLLKADVACRNGARHRIDARLLPA